MKDYPFFPPQDNMSIRAWPVVINQEENKPKYEKERGRVREARDTEREFRVGEVAKGRGEEMKGQR